MRTQAPARLLPALAGMLAFAGAALGALGDRTLRQGMSGSDVLELQRGVTYLGYPTPRTDNFTSETKSDIVHYERSTGLTVDGVVSEAEGGAIARRADEKRPRGGRVGLDDSCLRLARAAPRPRRARRADPSALRDEPRLSDAAHGRLHASH
jgi:peptidoglycan hydrolase-like protein with peptidoglycan-binding domain